MTDIASFAYAAFVDRLDGKERRTKLEPLENILASGIDGAYCILHGVALAPKMLAVGFEDESKGFWSVDSRDFENEDVRKLWIHCMARLSDYKDVVDTEGYLLGTHEFYEEIKGVYNSIKRGNSTSTQIFLHHIKNRMEKQINNLQYVSFNIPRDESDLFYPKIMRIGNRPVFSIANEEAKFVKVSDQKYFGIVKNMVNISKIVMEKQ